MHLALAAASACGLQNGAARIADGSSADDGMIAAVMDIDAIRTGGAAVRALADRCVLFSKAHPNFLRARISETVIWVARHERPDAVREAMAVARGTIDRVVVSDTPSWERCAGLPIVVANYILPRHSISAVGRSPATDYAESPGALDDSAATLPPDDPWVIVPMTQSDSLTSVTSFAREVSESMPGLSVRVVPEYVGPACFPRTALSGKPARGAYLREELDAPGVFLAAGLDVTDPESGRRRAVLARDATAVLIPDGSPLWNYALASYLQAGAAVIGHPAGSNLWQVVDGYNGFLRRDCESMIQLVSEFLGGESTQRVREHAASEAESLSTNEAYALHLSALFDDA